MSEDDAKKLAEALGGKSFNSGGGMFIAYVARADGSVVAFTDECAAVYPSVESIGDVDAVLASIDLV